MKKFILILAILTFAGCMRADLETYNSEDFNIEYPADWRLTETNSEIQFWNPENTIKMALFTPLDLNFVPDRELNGISIMIRKGYFMSNFQIYYYDLGDEIIGFSAYFNDEQQDQVTQIQESFRATN